MNGLLRLATIADADAIIGIYGHSIRDSARSFESDVPSTAEMAGRIERTLTTLPWIVLAFGGDILGYAYAAPHRGRAAYRWSVEVSVYVAQAARRRGAARRLYQRLFGILREQGFVNAYAGVTLPNPASVGLHESLGFEPIGIYRGIGFKFDRWWDVGWWSLRLQDPDGSPAEPVALPDLQVLPEAF